jgi:hypothetical protein
LNVVLQDVALRQTVLTFLLRGAAVVVLPRPESFKRCTLPITALRLTPPSCAAIWLALKPSLHSFFSSSTRSSVQFIALGSNHFRYPESASVLGLLQAQTPYLSG